MFRLAHLKTLSNKVLSEFRPTTSQLCSNFIHTTANPNRADKKSDEILSVESVEHNLFENSSHSSSFVVNSKDLLRQFNNKSSTHGRERKFRRIESPKKVKSQDNVKAVHTPPEVINMPPINDEIGFAYTKLQRNDRTFQQLMLLVKSKKHREMKHQLLLEGRRLIIDAIKCGFPLKCLIFSNIEQLKLVSKFVSEDVTCYKVPQNDLSFWSTLTTCPGLMAILEKPVDMSNIWKQKDFLPITVICDQVREPNNVGSIIRACASIPVEQVILTKGCADPWDTKALRGGSGAQFVVPTKGPMNWDSILSILPASYNVLLAENNKETAKQMIDVERFKDCFVPYTDVPFGTDGTAGNFVVVIGGETEGVSEEAYQLLNMNRDGCCVHIPLANGIDSLNTSQALAILLFEIKRNLTKDLAKDLTKVDAI